MITKFATDVLNRDREYQSIARAARDEFMLKHRPRFDKTYTNMALGGVLGGLAGTTAGILSGNKIPTAGLMLGGTILGSLPGALAGRKITSEAERVYDEALAQARGAQ